MSSVIKSNLYDIVDKSLANKANHLQFKSDINKYMELTADKYTGPGPGHRPVFSESDISKLMTVCGLTKEQIMDIIKKTKQSLSVKQDWKIMVNNPVNIAIVLATRYYTIIKDDEYIQYCINYIIVTMYPILHYKYFKYDPNPTIMEYTVNNLSDKFKLRNAGILWNALYDIVEKAYQLHKDKIKEGSDKNLVAYIQDVRTRLNSFLRKIANEFYRNEKEGKYLELEHENFEEDKHYEADSNSYAIERMTNKVVTHLIIHGPDMKLVELSAKLNKVSVNALRNYTSTMIVDKHRREIETLISSILSIFLSSETEPHSLSDIGTSEFLIYCLKVYKQSNTINKNIVKIKQILYKWLVELKVLNKTSREATVSGFRKALYTFFVLTIQKEA